MNAKAEAVHEGKAVDQLSEVPNVSARDEDTYCVIVEGTSFCLQRKQVILEGMVFTLCYSRDGELCSKKCTFGMESLDDHRVAIFVAKVKGVAAFEVLHAHDAAEAFSLKNAPKAQVFEFF